MSFRRHSTYGIAAIAATVMSVSPTTARAQSPSDVAPATYSAPTTIEHHYELQLVGADAAVLAFTFAGAVMRSDTTVRIGGLGLLLAAPGVHLLHGNYRNAARSLGLRVSLPLAGMLVGFVAGPRDTQTDCVQDCTGFGSRSGMFTGAGIGLVAALVVDYVWLGKKSVRAPAWQPTVAADQQGFSVGAIGRF